MRRSTYKDRDFAFGQMVLTLRSTIGLTQTGLADFLGVSRRAVGDWEAGTSYPKPEHFKEFIALAVRHRAFQAGHEAEEIRLLWKAAHQKIWLDEAWLTALLIAEPAEKSKNVTVPTHSENQRKQRSGNGNAAIGLPFQTTLFVGRSAELTEIAATLSNPACRLLTLVGLGGIGKTRLALEVAAGQPPAFTEGVAFVSLASLSTSHQIVAAIGDTLGLSFAGQSNLTAYLLEYLRERHMLLVLDNFEHLLMGVDLVFDMLAHAPHIKILVTSREKLSLPSEWVFNVEGLSYPEPGISVMAQNQAELADYSAVGLFVQRARQIQPEFSLSESTLTAIVRVCQQVAGIPLAIELAAAGVRMMSVGEIERQIRANLDVLTTSARDIPSRHRSMRAMFDHSWNLLSEPERSLFSRLAVFRGGFTVMAAEQVAGTTLPALMALIDKSLLREVRVSNHEGRFALLEPIREYALERLAAQRETETFQRAHATYYLAFAETVMAQWDIPALDPATEQINRDLHNIRAALRWASDGGYTTLGLQLAGMLWRFWRSGGYSSEGRGWLDELLALDDANTDTAALAARLLGMHAAAWLASDQHDYARATQLFEQTVPLRRALGETEADTHLLHNAALQARAVGDYQRATTLLEEALTRNRALSTGGLGQSLYEMGFSLYGLALMLREQGNFMRATALFEESLKFHYEIGDRESMAQALLGLSDVARDQGIVAQTREYANQSLAIYREFGTQWAIGFALNNLAQAAYLDGNLRQASALVGESVSLFRTIQNDGGLAEVLVTLGHISQVKGDVIAAQAALTEALRIARGVGPQLLVVAALEGLASLIAQTGQGVLAVRILGMISALRAQMGTPLRLADQPAVEHTLAISQSSLGANAFATAWAGAREMTLEQILNETSFDALPFNPKVLAIAEPIREIGNAVAAPAPRVDWGDALSVPMFYGRHWELATLKEWVIGENCRTVSLFGMGGIGKSALSVNLMRSLAEHFEVVIWRSLRDSPTCEALLSDCIQVLAPQPLSQMPTSLEQLLNLLLEYLRSTRALLVLDNLETLLDDGEGSGRMRPGYESYGRLLRCVAESDHQSCLLLTSREKPNDLVPMEGSRSLVRALHLNRLDTDACEQLLAEKDVVGTTSERVRLIETFAGNPLALKIVAQTIVDLFDGQTALFLDQGEVVFGGVRDLLNEHYARLSPLEQSMMFWLAIVREPMTLNELRVLLVSPPPGGKILEAIDGLRRRSLVERGQQPGSFTLQSVVLEFMTAQLIEEASDEIFEGRFARLIEHGFELAQAREYVRETQQRLIVTPILERLRGTYPYQAKVEEQLRLLLAQLPTWADYAQGYAPANLLALLRLQRGNLRGLDLSRLTLRNVYLQGVEMQDTTLSDVLIQDSRFTETFDPVMALAVSSTGEYWTASGRRGEVRVWSGEGQTLLRTWQAHTDMIWSLTFSSDGRTLATSGSWDGTVKVWDVPGSVLRWAHGHTGWVRWLAVSPDSTILASSGNDAAVRLWDLSTGMQLQVLLHPGPAVGIAWSPDGRLLASGDEDGNIRLWEVNKTEPATCVQTIAAHTKFVTELSFSPDGHILASGSYDGTVKMWDVMTGHLLKTLSEYTDRAHHVVWSPDGLILASSNRDRTIWLWDVEQSSYRAVLQGHTAEVWGLAFTSDSRRLLSSGDDGTLRVWDVTSGRCVRIIQGYAISIFDIDWSPDGTHLVSGSSDGLVTVWDVTGSKAPRLLEGHNGVVFGVGWSPDGRWLASSSWDNSISLWDAYSGNRVEIQRESETVFNGLAWSPDGTHLASGTYAHGVLVWNMTTHEQQWVRNESSTWIRPVAWSPDGIKLAGADDNGIVYIWDTLESAFPRQLAGHHGMITSLAWSPNGKRLVSGGSGRESGEMFLWNTQTGEREISFMGHSGMVSALAWGATEEILVSGSSDGTLCWWDVEKGEPIRVQEAHQGTIQSLRANPDRTKLTSCGDDGAIMIWDISSGEHLQTLRRDRPYERLKITGIKGLTEAQKAALRALGAVE